jgi:hypothetical protein
MAPTRVPAAAPAPPPALVRPRPTVDTPALPTVSTAPSLASSVKQGFGWGLGNAAAHTLMNSVFSKPVVADPSPALSLEYKQCMKDFDDKEACKHLLK